MKLESVVPTVGASTYSTDAELNLGDQTGTCRLCGNPLQHLVVDLGMSPLCETFLDAAELDAMERVYPLRVFVCEHCFLVQLREYVAPEGIFTEYPYFSSYSDSWLAHAERYVDAVVERFGLSERHRIVELGSNDGYLLRNFVTRGIPVLGIEPAANVAEAAEAIGVPTRVAFFGEEVARELVAGGTTANLIIGNNVLAQVPDVNGFVSGIRILLAPDGVVTMEFPHLLRLIEQNQFDTIYHEHFSYFSLATAKALFALNGLQIYDVEELPTHGGSLRIFARHSVGSAHRVLPSVAEIERHEREARMISLDYYKGFRRRVERSKRRLLSFLIDAKERGRSVVGYGAPGKANTLLNYCGIRQDLLEYTVDRNPMKQGRFLPGTHIPIHHPDRIAETRPDVVLILPWNLSHEITAQLSYVREWGGQLAVPIPEPAYLD
jgi:C-methyltransferase-like protein/putative zinc binding protein/methyltransferase family protein